MNHIGTDRAHLTAIVAMDEQRGIGKNNQLLWHMPADLAHFKRLTINQTILMGRKTFLAIGKALPNRTNVVLTSDLNFSAPEVLVLHHLEAALELSAKLTHPLLIIGGAQIYNLFMPYVKRIELTLIHHTFPADTFFPNLEEEEWQTVRKVECAPDAKNIYPYCFLTLERINKGC